MFGEENLQSLKVLSLKEKIQRSFGSKIGFWSPSIGSDYIFNNAVKRGKLVEMIVRPKHRDFRWQEKTVEGKIKAVAEEIRNMRIIENV